MRSWRMRRVMDIEQKKLKWSSQITTLIMASLSLFQRSRGAWQQGECNSPGSPGRCWAAPSGRSARPASERPTGGGSSFRCGDEPMRGSRGGVGLTAMASGLCHGVLGRNNRRGFRRGRCRCLGLAADGRGEHHHQGLRGQAAPEEQGTASAHTQMKIICVLRSRMNRIVPAVNANELQVRGEAEGAMRGLATRLRLTVSTTAWT